MLFCPHCSAPQILLPEHMRIDVPVVPSTLSTGTVPPPHPQQVDWHAAFSSAALVAAVGAGFTIAGLRLPLASLVGTFWVVGGAVIALGLYTRLRPGAWMDARTGLRIGLVTGLLTISAIAVALAFTGVLARFGTHAMSGFDSVLAQQFAAMQTQITAKMREQNQDPEFQQKVLGFVNSPEVRGGVMVIYLGVLGAIVVLLSAGGGAFAGMLRTRHSLRQGQE